MKFETARIPLLRDIFVAARLYYGVHNNGLDYAHGSYLRNGLDSLVKQRGFYSVM